MIQAGQFAGTSISVSPLDGIERTLSFRRVADLPLVVSVALGSREVLASWRQELWSYAIIAAVGTAVLVFFTLFLLKQFSQQEHLVDALSEGAAALRASEERFRDYAESASDWYWETDAEHRFTYLSDRIRTHGIDPAAILGRRRIDLAADANDPKWREHAACLERREPFSGFVYRYVRDGEEHFSYASGKPKFDAAGRFIGYRGTGRDVTEVIRAERRLREAKTSAEAANRAKSEFLAGMSHELRTPLNAIIGFSDLIRSGICRDDRQRIESYAGDIHASGEHLLKLISDILEVSRIEAGKLELREETVDVPSLIADCVHLVRQRASTAGIALTIDAPGSLPALYADATRLKQIMLNLLSNAIKFTNAGGRVTAGAALDPSGDLVLRVADNGIGMSERECAEALEPFRQIDSSLARRHEGTGLGLPLTKAFVERHGGRLEIASTKGVGTTVSAAFPAIRVILRKSALAS
jgi:PAS domain S-box-containing protein